MKLAVVGSINTDMTVTAERIPLKGETLMGDSLSYIPGGKGANQAVAMAKLGAEVEMFGCVGNDDNGRRMLDNLNTCWRKDRAYPGSGRRADRNCDDYSW